MNDHDLRRADEADVQRSEVSAGMDQGLRVLSYLISGVLVYGLLGWVGDHFLGTHFLLPLGIIVGAGLSIYVIIRRFASEQGLSSTHGSSIKASSIKSGSLRSSSVKGSSTKGSSTKGSAQQEGEE